ncbi:hypothetical protein MA20_38750 [Bradyrhizobium japonicum]|uniref:Uncharacterized protein n=2 Tax=Bradyrhizobium TaxID=374 RepID=A0A0A3YLI9_BRAJP|nr:hypothetical protein MA20_38750 [Bradyrhizobium japonicum]
MEQRRSMKALDDRTIANLEVALEEACRSLPHGGAHEIRREIAQKLLDSAAHGNKTLSGLIEVARAALAEAIKEFA